MGKMLDIDPNVSQRDLIKPPSQVEAALQSYFGSSKEQAAGAEGVGNWAGRPTWPGYPAGQARGVGAQAPDAARPDASGNFRTPPGGGGKPPPKACGTDPVSTNYGGLCVCSPNECEYDPAIFCGWSALPFSTFKDQGDAPLDGPVPAAFAALRTIRITAERACLYRIRGVWFRAVDSADCTSTALAMLANVKINETPRLIETGGIAPEKRIGIPSSMFDDTFWVLPVDWGIIDPIQNNSRPLLLDWMTPCASDVHVVGVLFGDPLVPGQNGNPTGAFGNTMMFY